MTEGITKQKLDYMLEIPLNWLRNVHDYKSIIRVFNNNSIANVYYNNQSVVVGF